MNGLACPNPTCTHVFAADAIKGAESLTCPRCGTTFQFRAPDGKAFFVMVSTLPNGFVTAVPCELTLVQAGHSFMALAQTPEAGLEQLQGTLAGKSAAVLRLGRRAFYATQDLPYEQQLEALAAQLSLNALLEDAAEGVAAFLAKRAPEWKGR